MALIKIKARVNGLCRRNSRHVKGRKGCWGQSKASMGSSKKRK